MIQKASKSKKEKSKRKTPKLQKWKTQKKRGAEVLVHENNIRYIIKKTRR